MSAPHVARRLVGTVLVTVLLLASLLAWRLARGPIRVDFLVPRLEGALARAGAPSSRIGGAMVAWDATSRRLELRATAVELGGPSDLHVAVPTLAVDLDSARLLRGQLVVTAVDLLGPRLRLVRAPDGRLRAAAAEADVPVAAGSRRLLAMLRPDGVGSGLEHAGIRDGEVEVVDERGARVLRGSHLRAEARRTGEVIALRMVLALGEGHGRMAVHGRYRPGRADAGPFRLKIWLPRLAPDAIGVYWPPALAPEARRWLLANVSRGPITDLRLRIGGTPAALDAVEGSLRIRGATVRYLDAMPRLTDLFATVRFSGGAARAELHAAKLADLSLERGTVRIAPDAGGARRVAVDAVVSGPLAGALAVLDHEPVRRGRALPVTAEQVSGTLSARLTLAAPLPFRPAGLTVGASATMRDVAVLRVVRDWSLSEGRFELVVEAGQIALTGDARLESVPVTLSLRQALADPATRRLEATTQLDRAGRTALGLDPGAALDGPLDVRAQVAPAPRGGEATDLEIDLRGARLAVPLLGIAKPAGAPGRVRARLVARDGALVAVEQVALTAGEAMVHARAARTPDGRRWQSIDVDAGRGETTVAVRAAGDRERFVIQARDAGRVVTGYGYQDARGGRLRAEGTVDLAAPGMPLDGALAVRGLTVTRAPLLARIATLASLPGVLGALSDKGIEFEEVDAQLSYRDPIVTIRDGRARGPTMSLLVEGTVDRAAGTAALEGTLVPSYLGLEKVPARLPVVGQLVERAIPGVAFRARGPLADLTVTVEPLASLTPGALRRLLDPRRR